MICFYSLGCFSICIHFYAPQVCYYFVFIYRFFVFFLFFVEDNALTLRYFNYFFNLLQISSSFLLLFVFFCFFLKKNKENVIFHKNWAVLKLVYASCWL